MTATDHPVSPEDLMAYLDGELPLAQAAVVQAHMAGCDGCQRSSSDLRGVSRDMARWQVEIPPATMTARWRVPAKPDERGARFRWLLKPSIAVAALVAVVAVLASLTFQSPPVQMSVGDNTWAGSAVLPYPGSSEQASSAKLGDTARQAGPGLPLPTAEIDTSVSMRSSRTGFAGGPAAHPYAPAAQQKPTPAIARVASLRFLTRDFEATRSAVERIVAEMDGWFSQVSVSRSGQARALTAAVQFPAARLDAGLAALKPLGMIVDESLKGEDVTAQIVDVEARLSNARNTEKRLLDLLQRRTGALEDVLAAEREMARVREEIERFDAQRKSLDRRVTYATVNLVVMEETPATLNLGPRPVPGRFRDAFVTGVTEAVEMALGLTLLLLRFAPTLILWVALLAWPVLLLVRWGRRRVNLKPEP